MLEDRIKNDLIQAQKDRDELKVSTLRMLLSEARYAEIRQREGERSQLSEEEMVTVIQREVKKRKEAAEGFRQGGRTESAEKELKEAEILSAYLPAQLSDEELSQMVEDAIRETEATAISDMGRVMALVMGKVEGRAEGARVSSLVKEKLLNK
jgi:uncharacterized protein